MNLRANKNHPIKISFIGDIFPGELFFTRDIGSLTKFESHKGEPWLQDFKRITENSDLVIGNLECPIVQKNRIKQNIFYGSPGFGEFLSKCGIHVINIANNHILEHGVNGFNSTISELEEAGIGVIGHVKNNSSSILYKDIKGLRIGIAGFSNVDIEKIENNNKFAVLNDSNVLESIQRMSEFGTDLRILNLHWGNEYINIPSLDQRNKAYKYIDAGASIIAGHHPHVIQPYEEYKDGHIFYSLGNFMFDYLTSNSVSTGMIANVKVSKDDNIQTSLSGVRLSYNRVVELIAPNRFKQYYEKVINNYKYHCNLSEKDYQDNYNKTLKINRFLQRIMMKISILKYFFIIRGMGKVYLTRNVFMHYYEKLRNRIYSNL